MGDLAARCGSAAMMPITAFRSVFFGWKVVAASFTIAAFTFGVGLYGPSVFLNVLHQQRGWPVSVVSVGLTVHFLVSGILVARLPDAHRRFGVAAVTQAGVAALVVGMFGWSLAGAPWQLFLAAILSGAGWAATSGAAIIAMVSPWFDRRRALALGHAFNGASVGGILFTPLWVMLIAAVGFPQAVAMIGCATLVVLWPLARWYLRPTPDSLGLLPDGSPAPPRPHVAVRTEHPPLRLAVLLADRGFITLSAAFALGLFAQVGVIAHLVTRLVPLVGAVDAAAAVSLATASAVIGRVLLGMLLGDANRRIVAAGNFTMQACGVVLLAFGSTAVMLVPGCILFGLGIGSLLSLPPLIGQTEFAPADVPRVVALVTAVNQTVFAFAPAVFGVLTELSGGYVVPFLVAAAVQVIAAVVVIRGRVRSSGDQFARE
jgi:MFS family permease